MISAMARCPTSPSWIFHHSGRLLKPGAPGVLAPCSTTRLNGCALSSYLNRIKVDQRNGDATPAFDRVLIANRGEIACRVIRTAHAMGMETVAIHSEADVGALHTRMATISVPIGIGPAAADSYLREEEIVEIAKEHEAKAIHSGYGFLSEKASFAALVESTAGVTFVGPPSSAIAAMGSKSESKDIMSKADVPLIPGYHGSDQDPEYLLHQAVHHVGFPLLIKATLGGGGKGMRVVHHERDFLEALESCQRQAMASFGNKNVLLEKYLVDPRHVEVQIVRDEYGNGVHLFERDCSLQRRHQKVLEEAPASDLSEDVRKNLGEAALAAAKAVDYVNAGTVEFLLDPKTLEFYFCEMNTRLQVEHPVTELITGIDLVEWQFRIAAGEELPVKDQDEIACEGHAFEARIYAEKTLVMDDGSVSFMPATGTINHHKPPPLSRVPSTQTVRVDTGIESGSKISLYYDPMISKLIVHGKDRSEALSLLNQSLYEYQIAGVPNNLAFLRQCVEHETLRTPGATNTGFLEHNIHDVLPPTPKASSEQLALGAFRLMLELEGRQGMMDLQRAQRSTHPWSSFQGSWRVGGRAQRTMESLDSSTRISCLHNQDGSMEMRVQRDGEVSSASFLVDGTLDHDGVFSAQVNGKSLEPFSTISRYHNGSRSVTLHFWPSTSRRPSPPFEIAFHHPLMPPFALEEDGPFVGSNLVHAIMPGKVVRVVAQEADLVKKGDVVIVLEAMKMEHSIRAPNDGIVSGLSCELHEIVGEGSTLFAVDGSTTVVPNENVSMSGESAN